MARRNSDWFNKLPTHNVVADVALMNTIQVPKGGGEVVDGRERERERGGGGERERWREGERERERVYSFQYIA